MRRYLKFSSLGVPGTFQIDNAGDFLLAIDDIVGTANISTDEITLLLTQPVQPITDGATAIKMKTTNSGGGLNPAPVVYESIMKAITAAPGGNVNLDPFLPEGYAVTSWELNTWIV